MRILVRGWGVASLRSVVFVITSSDDPLARTRHWLIATQFRCLRVRGRRSQVMLR